MCFSEYDYPDTCWQGYCPKCLDECMEYDEEASWHNSTLEHHVFVCPMCGHGVLQDLYIDELDPPLSLPPYDE